MSSKKRVIEFLKGARKYRVKPGVESKVIRTFLESLDCPRALTVWLLYESGEHAQLASLGFLPETYDGVESVRTAYAATKFLSKFKGLNLGYDLNQVAFSKFLQFEELCKRTNQRFRDLSRDPLFTGPVVHLHNACVRKIQSILGDWSIEEFFDSPDWGPGATTLIKRSEASPEVKFQCETGVTRDLHALLPIEVLSSAFPHWGRVLEDGEYPTFQVGNRVVTVAKDAKANRVIAIEPGVNLFFQKSVGEMIRRRLLFTGTDIRNQGKNQKAARRGSIFLDTATLDLSSASDSISTELVRELLPPDWFGLMDSCRSQYGVLKGQQLRWEKFSSMGNGFTFPLQTLIFYALAFVCTEDADANTKHVSVYGDDIILPCVAFDKFSAMLDFYGFKLNLDKSFINSEFRESCGSHYYAGVDVKPFYLKDRVSSLMSVFHTANSVRRFARLVYGCDKRFFRVHRVLTSVVPSQLRLFIPEGLGDGGFIGNFDEAAPRRMRHGIEGYCVKAFTLQSLSRLEERPGYLLAELWRIDGRLPEIAWGPGTPPWLIALDYKKCELSARPARKNEISTSRTTLKLVESHVSQWVDLGPWI